MDSCGVMCAATLLAPIAAVLLLSQPWPGWRAKFVIVFVLAALALLAAGRIGWILWESRNC